EMATLVCPEKTLKDCREGEANVVIHVDGCPEYKCECMPIMSTIVEHMCRRGLDPPGKMVSVVSVPVWKSKDNMPSVAEKKYVQNPKNSQMQR
ncbi:hypothetical protein TNIN_19851, partial [Trichonephila inaurata madagascariensis]